MGGANPCYRLLWDGMCWRWEIVPFSTMPEKGYGDGPLTLQSLQEELANVEGRLRLDLGRIKGDTDQIKDIKAKIDKLVPK